MARLHMTRRKAALTAGLIVVLVIATFLFRPTPHPPVELLDGSILTLKAITIGSTAKHYYGSLLTRLTEKLPASLRNRLPVGREYQNFYHFPSLVFWMELDTPHEKKVNAGTLQFVPRGRSWHFRTPFDDRLDHAVAQRTPRRAARHSSLARHV